MRVRASSPPPRDVPERGRERLGNETQNRGARRRPFRVLHDRPARDGDDGDGWMVWR